MGSKIRAGALAVVALVFVAATSGPAGADPGAGADRDLGLGPAMVVFEGRTLDLSKDWEDAQACLVWRQGGVLRCFRTAEAMEGFAHSLSGRPEPAPKSTAKSGTTAYAASYSCSSSLRLFDNAWYGGRQLWFWDRGYWQNMYWYGFDDRTSAYAVGGCYVHLAEHPDGGGWWYPGNTYPYAGEPYMSWGWDNIISSIYIE